MARRTAFTLVELMLVGMLTLLVSLGTYALAYRAWRSQEEILIQNEVARQARVAADAAADVLRNLPWDYSVRAVSGAGNSNSYLGYYAGGLSDCSMAVQGTTLRLADEMRVVQASVSNVTRFKVAFVTRAATPAGGILETLVTDFNNDMVLNRKDLRLPYVVAAVVTVTASRTSSDRIAFTSTATSTVKIRNNFYLIAP